ncbi:MAG: C45 family autoproteolytic acyltransferase/hydrolase [Kofleriaceae bacterium]
MKPLFLARLVGSQEQMGAQHGRLIAADAQALVGFYRTMPERTLAGGMGAASRFVVRQLATAWQARLAQDRPAEFAARTRAYVDAVAEQVPGSERWIARLQLAVMDTMQNCVTLAARAQLGPFATPLGARASAAAIPACTSVMAWGSATVDGELMFARNFDFPGVGVWDRAPAFVTCVPDRGMRYGFFATRGADAPVVTVVNEAGLVMAPHTRWHRDITWGGAMIVDVVHEIARSAETLEDAIRIARSRPASSSWGLAIGSARERAGLVLELAGRHVEIVRPPAGAEHLACANRYRAPALLANQFAASAAWAHHSDHRERRMRALVEARTRPLTPRDLAGFLGDRMQGGVRRHLGSIIAQPTNVHAVVVAPAARRAWVGVDEAPSCEGTWAELAWQWDGPAGGWELGNTSAAGFEAQVIPGFTEPHDAATRHVREGVRVFEHDHDIGAARASIEKAVALAPDDPSLRLAAAWLALESGARDRAVIHVHAGLATETEPYRRGQLLACGVRASEDRALAKRWDSELARMPAGDAFDELRAGARRRGRIHTNLVMCDAY